jgi:hypothetical protein
MVAVSEDSSIANDQFSFETSFTMATEASDPEEKYFYEESNPT